MISLKKTHAKFNKMISAIVALAFFVNLILPAQGFAQALSLPAPGTMLTLTPTFAPPIIKGIEINPSDPFQFNFFVNSGEENLQGEALKTEAERMIKYFLASLTIPENDLWVNLSPFEQDRIIEQTLSLTDLGRDLLAEDYLLKQIMASVLYPEDELGKAFWQKVYQASYEKFGSTDIPMDTFHKVWILPDKAVVYENGNRVFVAEASLKVMLEEDYVAMQRIAESRALDARGVALSRSDSSWGSLGSLSSDNPINSKNSTNPTNSSNISTSILREIVIPEITREVNEGKHFAQLRQIYHALILANWYKDALKESILGKLYVDQKKIEGIRLDQGSEAQPDHVKDIYNQYLEAFKTGVYNYIKVEYDANAKRNIPRKYFSGGADLALTTNLERTDELNPEGVAYIQGTEGSTTWSFDTKTSIDEQGSDQAMITRLEAKKVFAIMQNAFGRPEKVRVYVKGKLFKDYSNFRPGNEIDEPQEDEWSIHLFYPENRAVHAFQKEEQRFNYKVEVKIFNDQDQRAKEEAEQAIQREFDTIKRLQSDQAMAAPSMQRAEKLLRDNEITPHMFGQELSASKNKIIDIFSNDGFEKPERIVSGEVRGREFIAKFHEDQDLSQAYKIFYKSFVVLIQQIGPHSLVRIEPRSSDQAMAVVPQSLDRNATYDDIVKQLNKDGIRVSYLKFGQKDFFNPNAMDRNPLDRPQGTTFDVHAWNGDIYSYQKGLNGAWMLQASVAAVSDFAMNTQAQDYFNAYQQTINTIRNVLPGAVFVPAFTTRRRDSREDPTDPDSPRAMLLDTVIDGMAVTVDVAAPRFEDLEQFPGLGLDMMYIPVVIERFETSQELRDLMDQNKDGKTLSAAFVKHLEEKLSDKLSLEMKTKIRTHKVSGVDKIQLVAGEATALPSEDAILAWLPFFIERNDEAIDALNQAFAQEVEKRREADNQAHANQRQEAALRWHERAQERFKSGESAVDILIDNTFWFFKEFVSGDDRAADLLTTLLNAVDVNALFNPEAYDLQYDDVAGRLISKKDLEAKIPGYGKNLENFLNEINRITLLARYLGPTLMPEIKDGQRIPIERPELIDAAASLSYRLYRRLLELGEYKDYDHLRTTLGNFIIKLNQAIRDEDSFGINFKSASEIINLFAIKGIDLNEQERKRIENLLKEYEQEHYLWAFNVLQLAEVLDHENFIKAFNVVNAVIPKQILPSQKPNPVFKGGAGRINSMTFMGRLALDLNMLDQDPGYVGQFSIQTRRLKAETVEEKFLAAKAMVEKMFNDPVAKSSEELSLNGVHLSALLAQGRIELVPHAQRAAAKMDYLVDIPIEVVYPVDIKLDGELVATVAVTETVTFKEEMAKPENQERAMQKLKDADFAPEGKTKMDNIPDPLLVVIDGETIFYGDISDGGPGGVYVGDGIAHLDKGKEAAGPLMWELYGVWEYQGIGTEEIGGAAQELERMVDLARQFDRRTQGRPAIVDSEQIYKKLVMANGGAWHFSGPNIDKLPFVKTGGVTFFSPTSCSTTGAIYGLQSELAVLGLGWRAIAKNMVTFHGYTGSDTSKGEPFGHSRPGPTGAGAGVSQHFGIGEFHATAVRTPTAWQEGEIIIMGGSIYNQLIRFPEAVDPEVMMTWYKRYAQENPGSVKVFDRPDEQGRFTWSETIGGQDAGSIIIGGLIPLYGNYYLLPVGYDNEKGFSYENTVLHKTFGEAFVRQAETERRMRAIGDYAMIAFPFMQNLTSGEAFGVMMNAIPKGLVQDEEDYVLQYNPQVRPGVGPGFRDLKRGENVPFDEYTELKIIYSDGLTVVAEKRSLDGVLFVTQVNKGDQLLSFSNFLKPSIDIPGFLPSSEVKNLQLGRNTSLDFISKALGSEILSIGAFVGAARPKDMLTDFVSIQDLRDIETGLVTVLKVRLEDGSLVLLERTTRQGKVGFYPTQHVDAKGQSFDVRSVDAAMTGSNVTYKISFPYELDIVSLADQIQEATGGQVEILDKGALNLSLNNGEYVIQLHKRADHILIDVVEMVDLDYFITDSGEVFNRLLQVLDSMHWEQAGKPSQEVVPFEKEFNPYIFQDKFEDLIQALRQKDPGGYSFDHFLTVLKSDSPEGDPLKVGESSDILMQEIRFGTFSTLRFTMKEKGFLAVEAFIYDEDQTETFSLSALEIVKDALEEFERGDYAMTGVDPVHGGIDFARNQFDLEIKRDENGRALPFELQNLEGMSIQSLTPVIINFTIVTNLPMLLGYNINEDGLDKDAAELLADESKQVSYLN